MADQRRAAIRALTALARETEHDFPGLLASILAQVAGNLGPSYAVIESRPGPGPWQASHIEGLLTGTVGDPDRYLPPPMDAKLTDAKAGEIKDADLWGDMTHREMAGEFGVSPSTVSDIASGKTRGWLK